jgi:hypothetical protein
MRTQTRLLLGVAAVILALVGALVGWLVAVSRQATLSDAIVSAILTGAFTLLGAGIGLVVPLIQDWERNRPDLKLQLSYRCLHASPGLRLASAPVGSLPYVPAWIRCAPDAQSANLFLLLDIQAQNRGHLDDALTEVRIELPSASGSASLPVRLPDGSEFFGESIAAHQLRHLRLRLILDQENYQNTVNWIPDQSVVWKLVAKTINDQTIIEEIRPAGHFPAFVQEAVKELDDWGS